MRGKTSTRDHFLPKIFYLPAADQARCGRQEPFKAANFLQRTRMFFSPPSIFLPFIFLPIPWPRFPTGLAEDAGSESGATEYSQAGGTGIRAMLVRCLLFLGRSIRPPFRVRAWRSTGSAPGSQGLRPARRQFVEQASLPAQGQAGMPAPQSQGQAGCLSYISIPPPKLMKWWQKNGAAENSGASAGSALRLR